MASMQERVVRLISMPPDLRNVSEIRAVIPWLRKKSEILNGSDSGVLMDVIRNCAYLKAMKDEIIIRQADRGDCFCIMLTGRTSVYIDTLRSGEDPGEAGPTSDLNQDTNCTDYMCGTVSRRGDENHSEHGSDKEEMRVSSEEITVDPEDRDKYGKFIINYEAGKSFGEVALLSEDSVRNATVIADDETDLLVIYRDLYNRSIKTKQQEEYAARATFVSECYLFSDWTLKFKRLLEMSITQEKFLPGDCLVRQGDFVKGLYFIMSGLGKVVVSPSVHEQQYDGIGEKKINPDRIKHSRTGESVCPIGLRERVRQGHIYVRRKDGYAAAEKRHWRKNVELCYVILIPIVGDVEHILGLETNMFTLVCVTETTVFVLNSKNYERLIQKKNQQSLVKLTRKALQKTITRMTSSRGSEVSSLPFFQQKLQEKLDNLLNSDRHSEDRDMFLEDLIDLFLKDKIPLIEPCVPDSLYYRQKSQKNKRYATPMMSMSNVDTRTLYRKPVHKHPRSMKQLRSTYAEQELLYDRPPLCQTQNNMRRPRTAIGLGKRSVRGETFQIRPRSAFSAVTKRHYHITESQIPDTPRSRKESSRSLREFDPLFGHMEDVQRDKEENSVKVAYSLEAKSDLIHQSGKGGYLDELGSHDYACFDDETGDDSLRHLEDRIQAFLKTGDTTSVKPFLVGLKRFDIEKSDQVPIPGGTVFVRRKKCFFPTEMPTGPGSHEHVRRYIVTRSQSACP
ncbi:hypothetical protein ScPMuIL_013844 [Solemya velum]